MALQIIFKTADELSSVNQLSELTEEKFQEIRNKFLNYKSIYHLRYINLLQDINDRQLDLNVVLLL